MRKGPRYCVRDWARESARKAVGYRAIIVQELLFRVSATARRWHGSNVFGSLIVVVTTITGMSGRKIESGSKLDGISKLSIFPSVYASFIFAPPSPQRSSGDNSH